MKRSELWKFSRVLVSVALLAVFVLQIGASSVAAAQAQENSADLVLIKVKDEAKLNELASMGLSFFTQMGALDGGWALVARIDGEQQAVLTRREITQTILESNVPAEAKGYYLLYGLPDDLSAVQEEVPVLVVENRQALAKLSPAQVSQVESHGIHTLPVTPFQLTSTAAQPTTARALAPDLDYSPAVQSMVNGLTQNTLANYVGALSGEQPAVIDGGLFTLTTRSTMVYEYITKATRFGYEHFVGLGLPADFDYFNFWGIERRNVIAEQIGVTQPDRIYLLTAHLDSTSNQYTTLAPGADDNASGSAAVMAIADILSNYNFACTLRYALFTGEEQGLYGSIDYATEIVQRGDNLQGVLNLDMLGYNSWASPATIDLHTRPGNAGDLSIAYLFRDAVAAYSLPLTPLIRQDNLRFSDHAPFWDRGFPALLAIEDWTDHTPHYHQTTDQLENLNMPYYTAFVKGALATFAHMGCLLDDGLSGSVTRASNGSSLPNTVVSAWKSGQAPQSTLTNAQGDYYLNLTDGTYTVKFSAADHQSQTVNNVAVASGEAAMLDRALQPCSTIKGLTWSSNLALPSPGQQVSFQAAVSDGLQPVTYTWSFSDGGSGTGNQAIHSFSTPGIYPVKITANNSCDYAVEYSRFVLVGVNPAFLPFIVR